MPLPNQSSKTLDSLETSAVRPRIPIRKLTSFLLLPLHSSKLNCCLLSFAKETQVDHLEHPREGGTTQFWRALKKANSSADFNFTLFYYFFII